MTLPKIIINHTTLHIIWFTKPADCFCIHLKHWKEADLFKSHGGKACDKCSRLNKIV